MPYLDRSRNVVFVAYHSINEYSEDRIRVPNIVTPATFEEQIQYLASSAEIIPLQEFHDHVEEGKPIPRKSVVVTFDDGYKDNLTIAAPILQKYGVPATFYIATGYISADEMKWEDQLSCLVRRSETRRVSVRLSGDEVVYPLRNTAEKFKAVNALVGLMGHVSQAERMKVLEEMRTQFGLECTHQAGVMMTWDDVRQLANTPGFSIGSHTVTHQHLTRIPLEAAEFELTASKTHLENEIGMQIKHFSYPYGDYNQDVISAAKQAGYASAVTIEYGQNNIASDPFRLKRVLVPNRRGTGFRIGMKLRSSLVGEFLRRGYNLAANIGGQPDPRGQTLSQEEG